MDIKSISHLRLLVSMLIPAAVSAVIATFYPTIRIPFFSIWPILAIAFAICEAFTATIIIVRKIEFSTALPVSIFAVTVVILAISPILALSSYHLDDLRNMILITAGLLAFSLMASSFSKRSEEVDGGEALTISTMTSAVTNTLLFTGVPTDVFWLIVGVLYLCICDENSR